MNEGIRNLLVRTAAILTDAYVAGTVVECNVDDNQMVVYVTFTKGSLTTAELKIEFSHDNTTFYQETAESFTAGVGTVSLAEHQFGATGNFRLAVPVKDRYIKISVKGTGTVTSSSMGVRVQFGTV